MLGSALLLSCAKKSSQQFVISSDESTVIKDSGYSKMYISASEIKKESVDYLNFDYPFLKEKNNGVVKISKRTISKKDNSNSRTAIQIQPVFFAHKTASIANYSVEINADEIEFRDASLFAKKNGTDSTEDMYLLYNPLSGENIFNCTNDYYDIVIPNSKERRYIGFLSTKREKFSPEENFAKVLGKLYYSSNFKSIKVLDITVLDDKLYPSFSLYTPKIILKTSNPKYSNIDQGKRIALMNVTEDNKAEDFGAIQIEVTFYYGSDARELICVIPIKNDQLDMAQAVYDKKLILIK